MFHITDVFYWGNPNHEESFPLLQQQQQHSLIIGWSILLHNDVI